MTQDNNVFHRLARVIQWAGVLFSCLSLIFFGICWLNGVMAFWQALLVQAVVGGLSLCITSASSYLLTGKTQV